MLTREIFAWRRGSQTVVERLPSLIAELIALPVDAIAIVGAATAKRVSAATKTIPLIFSIVVDPVADGLVADARRPEDNMTGVTSSILNRHRLT